jgi:hypothetical protein
VALVSLVMISYQLNFPFGVNMCVSFVGGGLGSRHPTD